MGRNKDDKDNEEQDRIDGQEQTAGTQAESREDGVMGVKAQLRQQILVDIKRVPRGKLMFNWPFQLAPKQTYIRTLYPFLLALGYETDLETVCDVVAEMLEEGDVMGFGNAGGNMTGSILAEMSVAFLAAYNDKGGSKSREMKGLRFALVNPITGSSGKAISQEDAMRILAY